MPDGDGRLPDTNGLVPPQLLDAPRVKKVYPPLQWRPLRVMNPWHKLAALVGLWAVGLLVASLLGLVVPSDIASSITEPFLFVGQLLLARSFRGYGEPVEPARAWWRLTARPRAGWWLAVFYAWGAFGAFSPRIHAPIDWMLDVEFVFWAAAFLNSSIRLTIERRRAQPSR